MKQEILHLLKIVLIGLCCQEIAGHRAEPSRHRRPNRHAYEPLRQLPYYQNNKYYLPPRHHPHHHPRPTEPFPLKNAGYYSPLPSPATFNNFPPFHQLQPIPDPSPLQYQSPDFPVFYHENIVQQPQYVQNVPLYYPVQNVQYEFDQNQLGYHFYPYDPSLEKNQHNEIINIKAPIQIIPSRFPPRIEQIIERIQNYFSTYSQVEGQRPDYDPNLKPPLIETPAIPAQTPNNTNVGNRIGNTTEEPMVTTTERVEETTPKPEHQPEDDVEIIIITNTTEDADAEGSSEVGIEVANKMGNSTEEPVDNQEEEQATEQTTEQSTEQENEEETTTDSNNEEIATESNDLVIKLIALRRKSRRNNS